MSSKNAHAVSSHDSTARKDIFIAFLISVTDRLGEGKACLGSLAQSTMVGGRGGERGGCSLRLLITPVLRKQRDMHAGAQLMSPLLFTRGPQSVE